MTSRQIKMRAWLFIYGTMRFDVPVSVFVSVCPSLLNPRVCRAHLRHVWFYLKLLKGASIFVLTLAAPVDRRGKITSGSCRRDLGLATACICFDCEWMIDTTCTSSKENIFSPVSICWLVVWFVSRITQKLLNWFPRKLWSGSRPLTLGVYPDKRTDTECFSRFQCHHEIWCSFNVVNLSGHITWILMKISNNLKLTSYGQFKI